jgi:hypothetical protein
MKLFILLAITFCIATISASSASSCVSPIPEYPLIFALASTNILYLFNTSVAYFPLGSLTVTNLFTNEKLLSIDFRPANNKLYAIGSNNTLYTINTLTGAATIVGHLNGCTIDGGYPTYSMNFDPEHDVIRVVDSMYAALHTHTITMLHTHQTHMHLLTPICSCRWE